MGRYIRALCGGNLRRGLEACGLHHPFEVVSLFAYPLVIVEQSKSRGVDRTNEGIGAEGHQLLKDSDNSRKITVIADCCYEKEGLRDEKETELDGNYEQSEQK